MAARGFLDLLLGIARVADMELARWIANLPFEERLHALDIVREQPLDFMDWLLATPSSRTAMCNAGSIAHFFEVGMGAAPGPLTPRANELIAASAEIRGLLDHDDDFDDFEDHDDFDDHADDLALPSPDLAPQPPDEVQRRFEDAVKRKQVVMLRVNSKTSGERIVAIAPERIIERGKDVMLLGVDAETQENRSYPLRTIVAACVRA